MRAQTLLFSFHGRIGRATFWWSSLALLSVFALLVPVAELAPHGLGVVALDAIVLIALLALASKRFRDRGRSPWSLVAVLVPLVGPLWLAFELLFRKGNTGENHYGEDPIADRTDYATVEVDDDAFVEDVARLHRTPVFAVATPQSVDEVIEAVKRTNGPLSIGGGRFSMGGQTVSPDSLHIDMRRMNRVLELNLEAKTIRVEAGIRWCDIQETIDAHDLAVKIMQTYANFTVGGSLSVNVHGRYVGLGPLILSVREITLVLANGDLVHASREENQDLFFGTIGGYGALGVIVEAELELADNTRVEQVDEKLETGEYAKYFAENVRTSKEAVFHNADLYVPHLEMLRAVTWVETKRPVTHSERLMPTKEAYPFERYVAWAVSETPLGKWRREFLIDPLMYLRRRVHWRNYEAGYDVGSLEPPSRKRRTYVLQEYFIPVARFQEFVDRTGEILRRHRVNMLNISVRHALPDDGTYLAWAREEVFAFVMYYKQRTRPNARERVGVWTRELIDAAVELGGAYYLPYEAVATPEQFHAAYPRAVELFALKKKHDPDFRLRNVLWDRYYAPWLATSQDTDDAEAEQEEAPHTSEFHAVWDDTRRRDDFYLFLQNIFNLFPEDRFHALITEGCKLHDDDAGIYRHIVEGLPDIKPTASELTHALPALKVQKDEMAKQTAELLDGESTFDGYLEIGSLGRYANPIREHVKLKGDLVLVDATEPSMSPVDVLERGQFGKLGRHVALADYAPLPEDAIADESVDLVTCFIGLHHIVPDDRDAFIASIARVLRPGGRFILRDHDVTTPEMDTFVSLVHTVFNAGVGESWATNEAEVRHFASVDTWIERLEAVGLAHTGPRLRQAKDPSDNLLVCFVKESGE